MSISAAVLGLFSFVLAAQTAQHAAESDWHGSRNRERPSWKRQYLEIFFLIPHVSVPLVLVHLVSLSRHLSVLWLVSSLTYSESQRVRHRHRVNVQTLCSHVGLPLCTGTANEHCSPRPQAAVASTAMDRRGGCDGVSCARFRKTHGIRCTCLSLHVGTRVIHTLTEHQVQYFVRTNNQLPCLLLLFFSLFYLLFSFLGRCFDDT